MNRIRGAARAASAAAAGLLLAGCGIKTTGVVESGAPAEIAVSAPSGTADSLVYFLTPDRRLIAMRSGYAEPGAQGALFRLLAGPSQRELASGLGTALPAVDAGLAATTTTTGPVGDVVEVHLPINVAGLSDLARSQIVCTAVADAASQVEARLRGQDTVLAPEPCRAGRL
ncbi:hypothetical protein C0216_09800 [Streptomyces globosus]|uniref:GerMN domain-containing protein n=1 Tax=Streptomyces globosus TaxID=68209 RepID=A0A344TYJ7_9ACTN|nr:MULTISPECIES: hypothetical protein [Streptomyces]AXE23718.1 hypothetical protein C0216_09800 [Streptomyces globosus]